MEHNIDRKDLRVGNYVAMGDKPTRVMAIYEKVVITKGATMSPKSLRGQPLTPEILTKCGFEKSEYEKKEQWLGPEVIRVQPYTKYRIGLMVEPFGFYYQEAVIQIRIISLHQLQNLYFALTGTELE